MASDQSFVEYVCEQANLSDALSYKKMFGESPSDTLRK